MSLSELFLYAMGLLAIVGVSLKVFKERDMHWRDGAVICVATWGTIYGLLHGSRGGGVTVVTIVCTVTMMLVVSRHMTEKLSRQLPTRLEERRRSRAEPGRPAPPR